MLASRLAMVVIEVDKTERGDKYGKRPTHCHSKELGNEHENGVYEKNVFTHGKTHDAFVYETGIWVKKCADNSEKQHTNWYWTPALR